MSASTDQVDRMKLFQSEPQKVNDRPEAKAPDVEDVLTGDDSAQAGQDSLAGFRAAVTDAQQEAETQLAIVLEQVQAEAVERVREEVSERCTAEFARVREDLEKKHADELIRSRAVAVQSIRTLTQRIQQSL